MLPAPSATTSVAPCMFAAVAAALSPKPPPANWVNCGAWAEAAPKKDMPTTAAHAMRRTSLPIPTTTSESSSTPFFRRRATLATPMRNCACRPWDCPFPRSVERYTRVMDSRYYHNPRCTKSRGALALLAEHGIEPETVAYLEAPPSVAELRALAGMLGLPVRALLRTGEEAYKALGLADPARTDEELLKAMHAHPILIERPIFVHGGRAVIGRPIENVLQLL